MSEWPDIPDAEVEKRCSCGVYVHVFGTVPDPDCPVHTCVTPPGVQP